MTEIFSWEILNEKEKDCKRRQVSLELAMDKSVVKELGDQVEKEIKSLYPDHIIERPGKLIVSLKDCDRQPFHYDFDPDEEHMDKNKSPLVCFVGVSSSSRIDLVTGLESTKSYSTVSYYPGDILIMDGLKFHRGCSYWDANYRIYFNASHKDVVQSNVDTLDTYVVGQPCKRNKFNPMKKRTKF